MRHFFRQLLVLVRAQLFRLFTVLIVLAGYAWFWIYRPEYLKWWSRTIRNILERGCEMLPYPWDARIEPMLIAFTPWAQLAALIFIVRFVLGVPFAISRMVRPAK